MFFSASVHLIVDEATLAENHSHLFLLTDFIAFIPDLVFFKLGIQEIFSFFSAFPENNIELSRNITLPLHSHKGI